MVTILSILVTIFLLGCLVNFGYICLEKYYFPHLFPLSLPSICVAAIFITSSWFGFVPFILSNSNPFKNRQTNPPPIDKKY